MISHDLGDGFRAVPSDAVCLNGMALSQINTRELPYDGPWALVASNNYAVDNEDGGPYRYRTLEEVETDKAGLVKLGEFSTCGGVVTLDSCKTAEPPVVVAPPTREKQPVPQLPPTIKAGVEHSFNVVVTRDDANFDRACDAAQTLALGTVDMDSDGYMLRVINNQRDDGLVVEFKGYRRVFHNHQYTFKCWVDRSADEEDEEE